MSGSAEWYEDDAFWAWAFPFMFSPERVEAAAEEVQVFLTMAGVDGGRVLDLGCGPGRHSVELAQRGFVVTGVDRTEYLLDKARAYAAERGATVEWVQEDMRSFRRPDAFDLAVSVFTSFGYFERDEENRRVLENVHESLQDGGTLVVDVMGREPLAQKFLATEVRELEGIGRIFEHRTVLDDWTRLRAEWTLVRGDEAESFDFTIWVYAGSELRRMLLDAGFESVVLYGGLDGRPYDVEAKRLVAVARKARDAAG